MNLIQSFSPFGNFAPMQGNPPCGCARPGPQFQSNVSPMDSARMTPEMMEVAATGAAVLLLGLASLYQDAGPLNGNSMDWNNGAQPTSGNSYRGGSPRMSPGQPAAEALPPNVNLDRLLSAVPAANQAAARKSFPGILSECQKQGVTNKGQVAYILSTAVHESAAGKFMHELASGDKYEGATRLGNTQSGDGRRFKGRGYVQVTGRRNYTQWSRKLGIDLVRNPQLAEDPKIASRILVQGMKEGTFTGRKLGDYINGNKTDMLNARKVVNGMDHAGKIGSLAQRLQAAL